MTKDIAQRAAPLAEVGQSLLAELGDRVIELVGQNNRVIVVSQE